MGQPLKAHGHKVINSQAAIAVVSEKECHDQYPASAGQARHATEKSVEAWKQGARAIADQSNTATMLPTIRPDPAARYFECLQMSIDLTRGLATRWAEFVTNMSGAVRGQAEKVSSMVVDQSEAVGRAATDQSEAVGSLATEQSEAVGSLAATDQAKMVEMVAQEQAGAAEQAEKEQDRLARPAERLQAKAARAKARERYEDRTNAKLAD